MIGYQDRWVNVEYGRSREIWGPMQEDNLVLSGNSPPYERLLAQLSLGKIKFRYFYGFLETVTNDEYDLVNRYITGRSIQYSNNKNLILGVSEVTILAGPYRTIDFAFFNPLALHLESDLNNHSSSGTRNYNNAIWALYCYWKCIPSIRLSASLAMDEITLEWQERKKGIPDRLGYFSRIAWTPFREPFGLTAIASYTRLDSYFGQHGYPYINFINRNGFLGNSIGNDADKISITLRLIFKFSTLVELELGRHRWGDNSLLENPYSAYPENIIQSFPSGDKCENNFLAIKIDSQLLSNLKVGFDGHIDLSHSGEDSSLEKYNFIFRYQLPLTLIKL